MAEAAVAEVAVAEAAAVAEGADVVAEAGGAEPARRKNADSNCSAVPPSQAAPAAPVAQGDNNAMLFGLARGRELHTF